MQEGLTIQIGNLVKWVLSALVALLLAAAWVAWLAGADEAWAMLGFTACTTSAAAAVAHVRCYAVNICRLVRVNADRISDLDPGPRPLR